MAALVTDVDWVFNCHLVLGFTIFLVFPFTRLVHIWSGFATLYYAVRPHQIVRTRKSMNAPVRITDRPVTTMAR